MAKRTGLWIMASPHDALFILRHCLAIMGQQQLLLLVFGIVVVGGTVVTGVHIFEPAKPVENREFVYQEALAIVHALQQWKTKPTVGGGGFNVVGFDQVSFRSLNFSHALLSNRVHKTEYACYVLHTRGPERAAEIVISAPSCSDSDYIASVIVRGPTAADLEWVR